MSESSLASTLVCHTSHIFFKQSENWIYTQLKNQVDVDSLVLTNFSKNLDMVDWIPELYSRDEELLFGIRQMDSLIKRIIGYYPSFYRQAKKREVDLIHAHFGPMGYYSVGLADRLKVPLVTTFYGYDASSLPREKPKWKKKYRRLFDKGDRFLVEGPAMKEKIEHLGCPSKKITVQHLGVDLDNYEVRTKYSQEQELKILMAGRFVEKKGFIYGLKAFLRFRKEGGKGTVTLIGDSSDTSDSESVKQEILNFITKNGLEETVHLAGMIPLEQLRKEYYKHNLFLAPSIEADNGDNEGGAPVTTIEAAATGLPIIGSKHGDIPEVVDDKETGLLAEEKDTKRLAAHLMSLYQDPSLRKQMGQAASKRMRAQFDAKKQGQKLTQIYGECLN
ncbi:glycosyltransferase [Fodinibius saliphilus]|uniref:glycosyltransferase n=1 Tax=Fodinibius saliphilus TaxID=1920650 RepID=UPI0011081344|nr:glycosyltransferase [Fodinibius saliphilus]